MPLLFLLPAGAPLVILAGATSVVVDKALARRLVGPPARAVSKAIDKYTFLRHLRESDATSFYRVLVNHAMELLPYVYTPTVGEACQTYHRLPIRTNGVYITADDAGKVGDALRTRARDVGAGDGDGKLKVAVVTDGERILGESRIPDPGSTPRRATVLTLTNAAR